MRHFALILICAAAAVAQMDVGPSSGGYYSTASAQRIEIERVPVRWRANPRSLTSVEEEAVRRYMREYGPRLSAGNRDALEAALRFLVGMEQSHVPLTRTPAMYLADYQSFTQTSVRIDKWVEIERQKLPPLGPKPPVECPPVLNPPTRPFCPTPGQPLQPICIELERPILEEVKQTCIVQQAAVVYAGQRAGQVSTRNIPGVPRQLASVGLVPLQKINVNASASASATATASANAAGGNVTVNPIVVPPVQPPPPIIHDPLTPNDGVDVVSNPGDGTVKGPWGPAQPSPADAGRQR